MEDAVLTPDSNGLLTERMKTLVNSALAFLLALWTIPAEAAVFSLSFPLSDMDKVTHAQKVSMDKSLAGTGIEFELIYYVSGSRII